MSDLLAAETGFPRSQLEEVYEAAKTEGAPFCETLAEAGLVSPEEVRRALRTKAAAAAADLASVQAREAVAVSIARIPLPSYEERFTFAGLEILQAAVMESKELEQATMTLPPTFASMGPGLPAALCFREWEESELPLLPISCCSSDSMSISEALEMALSGLAATQPSDPLMAEISPFALLTRGGSEHWLCAYDPPDLCLFQIHTRAHYHDLLEALLVQRRVRDRGPTPSAAAKSSHGCGA